MSTTTFDPFGETFLADPYPEFARLRTAAPVFWSPVLQYWVVSRYADCKRVLREYTTFSAANSLAPVTPPCARAGAALVEGGFRSIPTLTNVDPPAHGPHPADRLPRVHAAARRADGGVRPRDGAPVHRRPVRRGARRHRRRAHLGAARPGDLPGARRPRVGRRLGEDRRRQPAVVHVRPRGRGRAGGDRGGDGGVLALLRGAGRGPPCPPARRLHLRPRAHPRPRRSPAHPAGGRHHPVRVAAGGPRDHHEPAGPRRAQAAGAPRELGRARAPTRR